jgi:hypothetical protein
MGKHPEIARSSKLFPGCETDIGAAMMLGYGNKGGFGVHGRGLATPAFNSENLTNQVEH